jgi:hypothetical protein
MKKDKKMSQWEATDARYAVKMRSIKRSHKKKKTTMLFLCLSPVIPPIPSIRPNLPLFPIPSVHINTKVMSRNIQKKK